MRKICSVCKKEFYVSESKYDKRLTCSRKCNSILYPKNPTINYTCLVCGKSFSTTKNNRKTCSRKCNLEFRNNKSQQNSDKVKCARCNQIKHRSEFYAFKSPSGGRRLRSYCKDCDSVIISRSQNDRKKLFVEYKGGKCERCGYNKCKGALHFHHLDKDQKEFGINKNYSMEKMKDELDKCILLCANCHSEEHTASENW